jgi:SAM-dependent methyltransferase
MTFDADFYHDALHATQRGEVTLRARAEPTVPHPDDWETLWNLLGKASASNPARQYRAQLMIPFLAAEGDAPRIIDFGSGQGDLAPAIRRALPRAEVVGFELTHTGVRHAQQRAPEARFHRVDLLRDEVSPEVAHLRGWADVGICSEVLEHLDEPKRALRGIRAFLRPGGRLLVTVPGGPMTRFDRAIGHRKHFRRGEVRRELEESGYRVEADWAAGFPFFNIYKLALVLRGDAVLRDAVAQRDDALTRGAYGVFRALFRFNSRTSRWGWQMLLVARS